MRRRSSKISDDDYTPPPTDKGRKSSNDPMTVPPKKRGRVSSTLSEISITIPVAVIPPKRIETIMDLTGDDDMVLPVTSSLQSVQTTTPKDWSEWVSATAVRNHLLKDPILDWLGLYASQVSFRTPRLQTKMVRAVSAPKNGNAADNFTEFLFAQGNEFETGLIDYLYTKHGSDMFASIGGNLNARSIDKANETLTAMNRGVPFITAGVLHNADNATYGVPDLLVRSDWLENLVRKAPLDAAEARYSAFKLINPHTAKPPKYHYRVVDIKFSTLCLKSDGLHLLNSGAYPAYKGQLYIYNMALGKIQGYTPPCAYLLGRKWKYTSCGTTLSGTSALDRLGIVDFENVDKEYIAKTDTAIEWVKLVRKEGHTWNVTTLPLCRPELYPNMSQAYDYPWHHVKEAIAEEISEITSLWMCGVKNRLKAHALGVFRWDDPKCTPEILGVNGVSTSRILSKILDVNHNAVKGTVSPKRILNNFQNWQNPPEFELYVDFETLNDISLDVSTLPISPPFSMIFLIGAGYVEPESKKWIFKSFPAKELTLKEEGRICKEFCWFLREECAWYDVENLPCIHWAPAEKIQWRDVLKRHGGVETLLSKGWLDFGVAVTKTTKTTKTSTDAPPNPTDVLPTTPYLFDLLDVFKKEPIVISGCLGFGLKEIAKALHAVGKIETIWDGNSRLGDGTGAMLGVINASKEAKRRNIPMTDTPFMAEIIRYNEVDCKVLMEILAYLRRECISKESLGKIDITEINDMSASSVGISSSASSVGWDSGEEDDP